jgi:hypothetical protein
MATSKERDKEYGKEQLAMNTPPIVSQQEWGAARQQLLVKEKALTRARDELAAERRRMPWLTVDKKYEFDGHKGKVSLLDLFEGRRQLIADGTENQTSSKARNGRWVLCHIPAGPRPAPAPASAPFSDRGVTT